MRKNLLLAALLSIALLPACKKNNTPATQEIKSVNDIKVPSGFTWESSHNVSFSISITDSRFGSATYSIAIYDGDPYNGGNLLASGSASTSTPYTNKLYIPNTLSQVYVVKTAPDNSKIINTASVTGSSVSLSFDATDPAAADQRSAHRSEMRTTVDCSSGCTNTITTNTSNLNVNSGDVICITGNNITVGFSNVNGGTIRVCGTGVTLQNLSFNGPAALIVTSSGSATISGLNFNSASASIENDGTLTGSFADGGIFTNNGTYTSTSDFNLNSTAGAFTNNGSMTVNGNFNNSSHVSATNAGSLTVTGAFQQNGGSAAFINNCSLKVNGNYTQSAAVKNYSLIKVLGTCTINSSTELGLYNTAMLETNNFILDGSDIKGYGSTSLVKITGSVTIMNSGAVITGLVQVCSTNTVDPSKLTGGAATGCSLYIPVTGCNGDGNGTAVVADADGDGVPDSLDAYPTDPTKAYNSYYPSSTGGATVAFEDEWPAKGDYDMNDLVMGYKYQIVTNASNTVVQVIGTYTLFATGGNFGNGFAVQFPVASGNVTGVTGGTLQSGQTNAVVTIFTNMRSEMSQWNTVPGATQAPVNTYSVSFNVTSGPTISTFGLSGYNPFIWSATGREIHLPGHLPTTLADQTLFGTQDDNTSVSASRYYVTKTGLPYALDIPIMPFSYPTESTDITQAYLHFAAWAQSSGTTFADWYSNTASGYRTTTNIYTR